MRTRKWRYTEEKKADVKDDSTFSTEGFEIGTIWTHPVRQVTRDGLIFRDFTD